MHAAIQPQQQLTGVARERRIGMAVHADSEQLQGIIDLRQRQRDRRADMRFQLDIECVAIGLQLCLRQIGAGRRALRCLGQPAAQLIEQLLARQSLRMRAVRQ